MRTRTEELERALAFWHSRVIRRSGCWGWNANRDKDGYGTVRVGRTSMRATHLAWLAVHGELPGKGTFMLHKCDTPDCTNPLHLFPGTQRDNMQDRARKARDKMANGMHFNSKVTPEQVQYIRANWPRIPATVLAKEVGISHAAAWVIAKGKNHKGVE